MKHFMELDMKHFLDPRTVTFGICDLGTNFGEFGSRAFFGEGLIKP